MPGKSDESYTCSREAQTSKVHRADGHLGYNDHHPRDHILKVQAATPREGGAAEGNSSLVGHKAGDKEGVHIQAAYNLQEDSEAAEQRVVNEKVVGTCPLEQAPRQAQDPCERERQEGCWRVEGAVDVRAVSLAGHAGQT